jgi:hypothetical protein
MKASLLLFVVLSNLSCSEKVITTPFSQRMGTIHGIIALYDTLEIPIHDNSGVKVSIEGTDFSSVTDTSGNWKLDSIPIGTYALVFQKENFPTQKRYNNFLIGGDTIGVFGVMYQIYNDSVVFDSLVFSNYFHTTIYYHFNKPQIDNDYSYRQMRAFFSKSDQISLINPSSYTATIGFDIDKYSYQFQTNTLISFYTNFFSDNGFKHGEKIYMALYAGGPSSNAGYLDLKTGKIIYDGYSNSKTSVSFIYP